MAIGGVCARATSVFRDNNRIMCDLLAAGTPLGTTRRHTERSKITKTKSAAWGCTQAERPCALAAGTPFSGYMVDETDTHVTRQQQAQHTVRARSRGAAKPYLSLLSAEDHPFQKTALARTVGHRRTWFERAYLFQQCQHELPQEHRVLQGAGGHNFVRLALAAFVL